MSNLDEFQMPKRYFSARGREPYNPAANALLDLWKDLDRKIKSATAEIERREIQRASDQEVADRYADAIVKIGGPDPRVRA